MNGRGINNEIPWRVMFHDRFENRRKVGYAMAALFLTL
jgi:hypothetical protein